MKPLSEYNQDELEELKEKLEDRIDTTKEILSDAEDGNVIHIMSQRLSLYQNQLAQCKVELSKKR